MDQTRRDRIAVDGGGLVKRALDLFLSSVLLVLLAPAFAVVAVVVLATSGRPVVFKQQRLGLDMRPFDVCKFRTMYPDNDDSEHRAFNQRLLAGEETPSDDGLFKYTADPRITPVGRYLRRYSLDELPQLYNVLRSEMSLVGPRPSLAWESDLYDERFKERYQVRPGITGLWQVRGRNKLGMREMLELDVEYARTRNIWMDIRILLMTPYVVVTAKGAP